MRIAAAVILLAMLSYAGYAKAYGLQLRRRLLAAFAADITALLTEMRYRPRPIEGIALGMRGELAPLWEEFARRVAAAESAEEAWREAVESAARLKALSGEEQSAVLSLGEGLGVSGMRLQERRCAYVTARLEALMAALDDEISRKCGMYRRLGVLAGVAAALIVI